MLRFAAETEEQAALRSVVRAFVDKYLMSQDVHQAQQTVDRAVWARLATELGLAGLAVPESGSAMSSVGASEIAVVAEEFGRVPVGGWFLPTACLSIPALIAFPGPKSSAIVSSVVNGDSVVANAIDEPGEALGRSSTNALFYENEHGVFVTGSKRYVADAGGADWYLLAARDSADSSKALLLVHRSQLERTGMSTLDPSRPLAEIGLTDARAELVLRGEEAQRAIDRAVSLGLICVAAESLGGMRSLLKAAVEYGRLRHAFGQSIGSFQAFKLRAADMLIDTEVSEVLVRAAALAYDAQAIDADAHIRLAKAYVSEAYLACADMSVLLHGAIGFTWEHASHAHQRRARFASAFLGTPEAQRDQAATLLTATSTNRVPVLRI